MSDDDKKADRKGRCHEPQKTSGICRLAVLRGYPLTVAKHDEIPI